MAPEYEEVGENKVNHILRIEKATHDIPQVGRRLQRKAFLWLRDVAQLNSDDCMFIILSRYDLSEVFFL